MLYLTALLRRQLDDAAGGAVVRCGGDLLANAFGGAGGRGGRPGWRALGPELDIDPARWVIREVARPIHRISLVKFIREQLSQKDWDAFIEIYGIPGGVVIGPPNVPESKEAEYSTAASGIATGGTGYLPNGSSYIANVLPRGNQPFADHLKYLSEKLVLAATGGKLTMLAESGSGTLAGGAHADTFEQIARAEARRISELLDQQVVQPRLRAAFPEQDMLAYWSLAIAAETDVGEIVEHALKLAQAGYTIAPEELAEKTGYQVTISTQEPPQADAPMLTANRTALNIDRNPLQIPRKPQKDTGYPPGRKTPHSGEFLRVANRAAIAAQMSDLLERMESGDNAAIEEALELIERLGPETLAEVGALVATLERAAMEAAVLGAMGEPPPARAGAQPRSRGNTWSRDQRGRFASGGGHFAPKGESDAGAWEQAAKGEAAMELALATRQDVPAAMAREGVGEIDFLWGDDQAGLRHIVKRAEARQSRFQDDMTPERILMELPRTIAFGEIRREGQKLIAEHEGFRAILGTGRGRNPNRWLVSGYDINPRKA